jgi:hypothetical protein
MGKLHQRPAGVGSDDMLSVEEAAGLLGLDAASVRRHCRRGTLPARLLGANGPWVIRRGAVAAFKAPPAGRPAKKASATR